MQHHLDTKYGRASRGSIYFATGTGTPGCGTGENTPIVGCWPYGSPGIHGYDLPSRAVKKSVCTVAGLGHATPGIADEVGVGAKVLRHRTACGWWWVNADVRAIPQPGSIVAW
jgi:hypothetical protein